MSGHPAPFVSLRHRNFRLLWAGQLVSVSGSAMQTAAILWHVAPFSVVSGGIGCLLATGWIGARTPSLRAYRR